MFPIIKKKKHKLLIHFITLGNRQVRWVSPTPSYPMTKSNFKSTHCNHGYHHLSKPEHNLILSGGERSTAAPPYQYLQVFLWTAFREKRKRTRAAALAADHPLNNEWNLTTNFPLFSQWPWESALGPKKLYSTIEFILSISNSFVISRDVFYSIHPCRGRKKIMIIS